ncbi:MAG: transposase [Rhizobium sp.]|nr:transposase [Rhizobium sp.]
MRRPRLDIPGIPLHITHRGVNRAAVFRDDEDRQTYLLALSEAAAGNGVEVHGYVLMGNHVHLLASAAVRGGPARMMQALGRRYVRRHNDRHARTGTLWEGRFRSFPVDTDRYLLNCLAYIELNPVRAGLAVKAEAFPWSSVQHHLGLRVDPWVTPHPVFLALASADALRVSLWRHRLADAALASADTDAIREHTRKEQPLGSEAFQEALSALTGRRLVVAGPGRPRTRA